MTISVKYEHEQQLTNEVFVLDLVKYEHNFISGIISGHSVVPVVFQTSRRPTRLSVGSQSTTTTRGCYSATTRGRRSWSRAAGSSRVRSVPSCARASTGRSTTTRCSVSAPRDGGLSFLSSLFLTVMGVSVGVVSAEARVVTEHSSTLFCLSSLSVCLTDCLIV